MPNILGPGLGKRDSGCSFDRHRVLRGGPAHPQLKAFLAPGGTHEDSPHFFGGSSTKFGMAMTSGEKSSLDFELERFVFGVALDMSTIILILQYGCTENKGDMAWVLDPQ